jgi:carbamoyl-phosphate synthase large subunit
VVTRSSDLTLLIPGAAGAAGIGVLRWLRNTAFKGRLVATDTARLSAGFPFADASYVIGDITDESCYARMVEVITREKVDIILPTSPTYSAVCSQRFAELTSLGVLVPVADFQVVQICQDKSAFHTAISSVFPVPEIISVTNDGPQKYPCFVKPRWGSGSRNSGRCLNYHDWMFYSKCSTQLLAQELLEGPEYSVDVLTDMDGKGVCAVVRERLVISDGVTTQGRVIRDKSLESVCLNLASYLRVKGISCMQLKRDRDGCARFLEVNAHMAGTSISTMLAGVDLVRLLLSIARREPLTIPEPNEMTFVRYFDEIIVG